MTNSSSTNRGPATRSGRLTAEPLDADELAAVRVRSAQRMAGPSYTEADEDRSRLLATLDALRSGTRRSMRYDA